MFNFLKKKKDRGLVDNGRAVEPVRKKKKKKNDTYITIEEEEIVKPEKYYKQKSRLFGYARYASAAVLVVFILVMFAFFGDQFTGENFRYLMKHIDMNSSGVIDEFKTVVYDTAEGTVFCEYQQDFVIAAPGSLKIYDYKGVMTFSSLPSTESPRLSSSARYVLLYDRGDRDYYVYNSFSLLRQRECEGDIIVADMSDSGVFVIVTESLEYAAHIYVFNDNFEQISDIKKNSTVVGATLSEDGEKLAVITVDAADNAELVTTLTVYGLKTSTVLMEKKINGEVPVWSEFDSNGEINILTDGKLRSFDEEGNEQTVNINKSDVALFAMNNSFVAYSEVTDIGKYRNRVYLIDCNENKEICSVYINEKLLKIGVGGEYMYILTETGLFKVDKRGVIRKKDVTDPVDMIVSPADNVFVCYESRADLIKFDE